MSIEFITQKEYNQRIGEKPDYLLSLHDYRLFACGINTFDRQGRMLKPSEQGRGVYWSPKRGRDDPEIVQALKNILRMNPELEEKLEVDRLVYW